MWNRVQRQAGWNVVWVTWLRSDTLPDYSNSTHSHLVPCFTKITMQFESSCPVFSRWEVSGTEAGWAPLIFLLIAEVYSPFPKKKAEADHNSNVLQMSRSQREFQTIGKGEMFQFKCIPLTILFMNLALERFSEGPFPYFESGSVLLVHSWQTSGSGLKLPIKGIP